MSGTVNEYHGSCRISRSNQTFFVPTKQKKEYLKCRRILYDLATLSPEVLNDEGQGRWLYILNALRPGHHICELLDNIMYVCLKSYYVSSCFTHDITPRLEQMLDVEHILCKSSYSLLLIMPFPKYCIVRVKNFLFVHLNCISILLF